MDKQLEQAMKCYKEQNFSEAIKIFENYLEDDKNEKDISILNNLALCYQNLNEFRKAEEIYFEALKMNSYIPQVYINLSDIYFKENRLLDAIELLQNGVYLMPDEVPLHHYLARIYIEDKRYDNAIDELDKVLELSPQNYDANWDLGVVYFELGDYNSAISNFEDITKYIDTNPMIFYYLAMAYEANNETDKAISNYLKAIMANDKFHLAYKKLGLLFLARNDKEDALEYLNDYLEFDITEEEKDKIKIIIESIK